MIYQWVDEARCSVRVVDDAPPTSVQVPVVLTDRDAGWFDIPFEEVKQEALDTYLLIQRMRMKRDRLFQESDWTQLNNAPVDREAWAQYRQALRDLPQQEGFPGEVVWPEVG